MESKADADVRHFDVCFISMCDVLFHTFSLFAAVNKMKIVKMSTECDVHDDYIAELQRC